LKGSCIVFPEPKKATIGEIEVPKPGDGEVVTKTLLTGVSTGTETRVYRGNQSGSNFPLIPGYENLGEIVDAGPGATLSPGERVFVRSHSYEPGPYSKQWGSQVSHSRTSEAAAIVVPSSVPDKDAIYAKVAAISLHGVKRAKVRDGEWVVVVGLGIIGHFVVQHAIARGARVVAVDLDETRLDLAREAGAEHTFDAGTADVEDAIKKVTDGGANVAFDATGLAKTLSTTASYLRERPWDTSPDDCGRLVLQGTVEEPITLEYRTLFAPEIDLITSRDCDTQDMVDSLSLMAEGKIKPSIIPATVLPYTQAADAYPKLVDRELMRVLFSWET
jgi:2-desacetyl-2-hydroxyethyl bacteriochlorophyllide A dehydrogenase